MANLDSWEGSLDPYKIAPEPVKGNSLTQRIRSLLNVGGGWAEDLYGGGTSNLGQATDFYGKLLSGNRASMMEVLAPEVKTIRNQTESLARAGQMFGPRGGGRAAVAAETPYNMAASIQSLLQAVRPQAASQMSQIGLQKLGLSQQQLANLLWAAFQMRGQDLQESGQIQNTLGGLGKSLGGLLVSGAKALPGLLGGGVDGGDDTWKSLDLDPWLASQTGYHGANKPT